MAATAAESVPAVADQATEWIAYSDEKPAVAGIYRWRVESRAFPGMFVTFLGHMRKRGAGHQEVLSPFFDHWDGYRVNVPAGVLWKPATCDQKLREWETGELEIEGVENVPCPYCGKVPRWAAVEGDYQGTTINAPPHRYNRWWLKCCAWGNTPHLDDPRELSRIRNGALGKPA